MARLICVIALTLMLGSCCLHLRPPRPPPVLESERSVWGMTNTGLPTKWNPDSLPLLVTWHPDLEGKSQTIKAAARFWNIVIGTPVFITIGAFREPTVGEALSGVLWVHEFDVTYLNPDFPLTANTTGVTRLAANEVTGEIYSADVMYESHAPSPYDYWVLVHELGHVLGLGHDPDDPWSIMAPHLSPESLPYLYLQGGDAAALRALYGSDSR